MLFLVKAFKKLSVWRGVTGPCLGANFLVELVYLLKKSFEIPFLSKWQEGENSWRLVPPACNLSLLDYLPRRGKPACLSWRRALFPWQLPLRIRCQAPPGVRIKQAQQIGNWLKEVWRICKNWNAINRTRKSGSDQMQDYNTCICFTTWNTKAMYHNESSM